MRYIAILCILAVISCGGDESLRIFPYESIGNYNMDSKYPDDVLEGDILVSLNPDGYPHIMYTKSSNFQLEGGGRIGMSLEDFESIRKAKGMIDQGSSNLFGKSVKFFDGFFVTVEGGYVRGIGILRTY